MKSFKVLLASHVWEKLSVGMAFIVSFSGTGSGDGRTDSVLIMFFFIFGIFLSLSRINRTLIKIAEKNSN